MALTPLQQARELIGKSRSILCVTGTSPSIDALASLGALGQLLSKQNRVVDLVAPGYTGKLPSVITSSLPIQTKIGPLNSLHIRIPAETQSLSELSYTVTEGTLDISLIPKHGNWSTDQVAVSPSVSRYDLLITLGILDKASLIEAFPQEITILQTLPTINLSHEPATEAWATVSLHATDHLSLCEDIFSLATELEHPLDEPLATTLLTGVIAATNRFCHPRVSEQTLKTAAQLVEAGARRQDIMHELWRTTRISTLQLWGRALSRLEKHPSAPLIWTHVTDADLLDSGAKDLQLRELVQQIVEQIPEASVSLVFEQTATELRCHLFCRDKYSAADLARLFQGQGTSTHAIWNQPHKNEPLVIRKHILEILSTHLNRYATSS